MQLYYIRHGQSTNNAIYQHGLSNQKRTEDPELTEVGQRQIQHLARFLSQAPSPIETASDDRQNANGFGLTHIYASLMVRAVATASCAAEALNLPVIAWEDLHEEWGIYLQDEETGKKVGLPGKSRPFFEAHYPRLALPEGMDGSGWWNRPPEPTRERIPRARRVLHDLLERHGDTGHRVAIVSHGGFYQCFMTVLLDLPLQEDLYIPKELRFSLNNVGITRIDFTDRTRVAYANRLDFMPRDLIT